MRARTLVAFATIYLVWGSTYLAIEYAIESIPPLLMMGVRSLLAGAVLYAWARLKGAAAPERAAWRPAAIAGALMFLGSHGLLAWAELRVASSMAALVVATGTFWMIGVEWLRPGGQRPARSAVVGAIVGLGGVAILVGGGDGSVDPVGAGALLLSALLWAIGSVYARGKALPPSPQLASALPLLTGGVMLVAASVVTGEARGLEVSAIDVRAVLALLYLVVFGSIIAFSAYIWLLRTTSAVRVSTHNFVNPAVAVLLGWAVTGETITARALFAATVIITSIVVIRDSRSAKDRARVRRPSSRAPVRVVRDAAV